MRNEKPRNFFLITLAVILLSVFCQSCTYPVHRQQNIISNTEEKIAINDGLYTRLRKIVLVRKNLNGYYERYEYNHGNFEIIIYSGWYLEVRWKGAVQIDNSIYLNPLFGTFWKPNNKINVRHHDYQMDKMQTDFYSKPKRYPTKKYPNPPYKKNVPEKVYEKSFLSSQDIQYTITISSQYKCIRKIIIYAEPSTIMRN